ncbi:hypothetical protein Hrd1104_11405 [Halorhabdus sp. CBA1104]|nr:hypothetical protein Hrd1104_11405 [Halorhabdus sp. CBA1104]
MESITSKIGKGKDLKNSFKSELSDFKSELKDWTEKGSVKTAEWRTGDGESAGGDAKGADDTKY